MSLLSDNDNASAQKKDLLIVQKNTKQILSKEQKTFNTLIKKIEKLQKELEKTKQILDDKMLFCNKKILPAEKQVIDKKSVLLKQLYPYCLNEKLLNKADKKTLKEIIVNLLEDLYEIIADDEELKAIYKSIHQISFEEAVEQESESDFAEVKEQMKFVFEQFGFDMNLDDFHSKMTEEEIFSKTDEMEAAFKKQFEEKAQPKRRKTKKQQQKEEKEKELDQAKSKNIGAIYKQLAKLFHPDLEPDPELKLEKEELMKALVAAYESNNLHALLRMELMWIHKEENNIEKMTDDKLKIYNDVLKEQARSLETEIQDLYFHPQYQLLQEFVRYPEQARFFNFQHVLEDLEAIKNSIQNTIKIFQNGKENAVRELKRIIKERRAADREDDNLYDETDEMQEAIAMMMQLNKAKFNRSK